MNKPVTAAAAALVSLLISGPSLADGVAPNYGKCAPTGADGSIVLRPTEADTLTVATVLPNPGWWNGMTPAGVEDGFEYCIAAEIAHRAGLKKLHLVNMAWDQFISGTATGYDIAMATATITDKRKQVFDFSQPYFASNLGVAVNAGSDVTEENIRSKRIGVVQGNMGSDWVAAVLKPERTPSLYQSQQDMVTALVSGQVDAIITDTTLVLSATAATNGRVEVVGQFKLDQGYGVITPKGSDNSAAVDAALAELAKNGTLDQLSAKYLAPLFGKDPARIPMWKLN